MQQPVVVNGTCSVCGLLRGAHKWCCIAYFMQASIDEMKYANHKAVGVLTKLLGDKHVATDEVELARNVLLWPEKSIEAIKDE
jgi:hypothetical protein